jgi:hypothetical protein
MTKAKISEYDAVAANNTDVNGVNIDEGCAPSGMNNMGREIMAALKRFETGADGDSLTVGGNLIVSGTVTAANTATLGNVDVNGGTIDGTAIGGSTAAAGSFTTLAASSTLTVTGAGSVQGLTVGRGAGSISTNTAVGASALAANTTGADNTAVGYAALDANTTGLNNTAIGVNALGSNTTSNEHVAVGKSSLASVDGGIGNVALGNSSGTSITTGNNNVCVGRGAGLILTTGSENTLIGRSAGEFTGPTTGSRNVLIGLDARASAGGGSSQIVIVSDTTATGKGDNTGFIKPGTGGMYQGNNSSSWSTTSDQRLKKNIVDNTEGLDKINALRVRNFEYRTEDEVTELDPACAINKSGVQLGVIAQEIQQVCPDCVKEESTGVLSVDSDNVFWHMVNAIKELSAKCDSLQAEINTLKGQ